MMSGCLVTDQVEALEDRVGAAEVPPLADPLLGRHRRDVVAEHRRHPPGLGDVPVETVGLVLRQHDDLEVAGVHDVRQREVDQPVDPGERHRRLGPVGRQRHQPLSLPSGEHDREDVAPGFPAHARQTSHPAAADGSVDRMRVDVLTKEYPPEVYGGAGVHVAELVRALRPATDVEARVHAFGAPRDEPLTSSYADLAELAGANAALRTIGVDLAIADACAGTDLVHSHTWYANLAGHLAGLLHGVPHVVSAHSLEPLRPWKAEQLGGGYAVSSLGRDAPRTRPRPPSSRSRPRCATTCCAATPPSTRPGSRSSTTASTPRTGRRSSTPTGCASSASTPTGRASCSSAGSPGRRGCRCSCGRAPQLPPDVQIVLCAGAPDTPEIEAEVEALAGVAGRRRGPAWSGSARCCRGATSSTLLTAATVFACPSIYEPLGIVNLEAMACETAVVATATGGIPEVVVARRDRAAGPDRAGRRRHRHPARPGRLRRRLRRGPDVRS